MCSIDMTDRMRLPSGKVKPHRLRVDLRVRSNGWVEEQQDGRGLEHQLRRGQNQRNKGEGG